MTLFLPLLVEARKCKWACKSLEQDLKGISQAQVALSRATRETIPHHSLQQRDIFAKGSQELPD